MARLWLVIAVAGAAGRAWLLAQEEPPAEPAAAGVTPPDAAPEVPAADLVPAAEPGAVPLLGVSEPEVAPAEGGAPVEEAEIPPVEAAPGSAKGRGWELRAGALYRGGMDVDVHGTSAARAAAPAGGTPFRRAPRGIGNTRTYADRTYDDGFVNIDPGTAFPGTIVPGVTWFWGYENASQYSPAAQTLSFTKTGGESLTRSVVRDQTWDRSEDIEAPGFAVELSRDLPSLHPALSVVLGFQTFWLDDVEAEASPYEETYTHRQYAIVDRYDTSRGGPPPPAPYAGTYEGPGYLIGNRPDSRAAVTTAAASWRVRNRIELEIESEMYQFSLGPRLALPLHPRISLAVDPFLSLAYVSADAEYREELQSVAADGTAASAAQWRESACEEDWILGLGVRAGVTVGLGCGWSVGVLGGYDWLGDDLTLAAGPSTVELDPSGYFAGVTLGKEF